ncbi:MAG: YihY family inner membrane protein [Candidatus Sumerlaeia bacterium]|nr:YihY family inner membrane protein [Candidatus Sumerlaeia bacterium]
MARKDPDNLSLFDRLTEWLWADHHDRPWYVRWLLGELRVFYFVFKGFGQHQCALQASALTFVTLLAIVPMLALGLAMSTGLGLHQALREHLGATGSQPSPAPTRATTTTVPAVVPPALPASTAPTNPAKTPPVATTATLLAGPATTASAGLVSVPPPQESPAERNFLELLRDSLTTQLTADQREVRDRILDYVRKTNFSALGAVGIIFLIITSISALGTIEHVFNQIWQLRRARSLLRKFTDYLSVVVICPLLFAAAIAMTPTITRNAVLNKWMHSHAASLASTWFVHLAPYLSAWIALTLLYWFLPNTRVKLRCALAGGFIAGIIWQLAFLAYTKFQAGMNAYNAVYSTLAALPFFLSWLYTSWLIVLFGAEVAAAYQNAETYARNRVTCKVSPSERLRVGLNLVLAICSRFRREEPPWTADHLSRYLECPASLADELLSDLARAKIVMPVGTSLLPAYQPAVPLNHITPARVIEALQEGEGEGSIGTATPESIYAKTIMEQWRQGLWRDLGHVGFDVLVEELPPKGSSVLEPASSPPKSEPPKPETK